MDIKVPISAIIMTYNEEKNIEECLESIYGWVDEIFVVDSFSADRTIEIAKKYTDKIYQHNYDGHPQQWIWALGNLPITFEWVLALDADFRIMDSLKEMIQKKFLNNTDLAIEGYYLRHRQIFRGKWLRFGGMYP